MSRPLFSLTINKKYIGFGADSSPLTNPYKGWSYLKDALNILYKDETLKKQIEIVIFGCNYNKPTADNIPFTTHFLGKLTDEYSLVMVYNVIDVFVIPSLAENFPNTILESLSCNTPVVGFDVGGIPDTVNSSTGYLAEYKNADDLAYGIKSVLTNPNLNIRKNIEKYFSKNILLCHNVLYSRKE
jgi:glycosyltransferase involved in cell wall biosynthesis